MLEKTDALRMALAAKKKRRRAVIGRAEGTPAPVYLHVITHRKAPGFATSIATGNKVGDVKRVNQRSLI